MKRIIHLSDLHFGTERPGILDILIEDIHAHRPDIIVISGDLTQRAKHHQYQHAREFLNKFSNVNVLCVPGNHDISLYNFFERFIFTFYKFKTYISSLCPAYVDEQLAILGINSVTPYKPMGGYVSDKQLKIVANFFKAQPAEKIKIIVMHHNLIRSERHKIINDAEKIINCFANNKINLILSGHIHFAAIELLKRNSFSHNMYVLTAGTAISTRTIQANSYNIIEVDNNNFKLSIRSFNGSQFFMSNETIYPL